MLCGANLALHRQHGIYYITKRVSSLGGTALLIYTMVSILFLASFTQPTSFSVFQSPLLGSLPHLAFQLVGFGFARVVGSTTVFTSAMLCPYVRFRTLQTTRGGLALGLAIGYHHLSVCRLITIRSVPLERFHFTTGISIAASTNDSTSVSAPGIGISAVAKCFHTSCASVPSWVDAVRLATCANDSPSPGSRQGLFCLLPFQQVSSYSAPNYLFLFLVYLSDYERLLRDFSVP